MKVRDVYLIFGRTGTGKSRLAMSIILNYKRVIIIDPLYEYENGIIFYNFSDLVDYYCNNVLQDFCFICRFDKKIDIDYVFQLCLVLGNLLLVVEEAETYISPTSREEDFYNLVNYGRHKQISILGIARRTAELSTSFRAQVNRIYSFKQNLPNDIKTMESLGLFDVDKLPYYPDQKDLSDESYYIVVDY